jgi:multicomponent Na+:H+ antiporter subunit D
VLSYSIINQLGFMVVGVGIGTELSLNGTSAHAFAHIIYKALLFMSMGAVLQQAGTVKASELGGLYRKMPWTAGFCIVGAASISAFPLFSGFVAKAMVMSALLKEGYLVAWLMLLFASAGVMEHSGIKIPFFAFFSHDSGKRPKEAPFNMLLAMGLAAALCMAIGLSPRWLYELLPFRDRAMEYLAQDLFTPEHILEQMQLLAFATLAFMVLKRFQLYPAERPGEIIDIEWTWRKAAPGIYRKVSRPVAGLVASVTSAAGGAAAMAGVVLRQAFAPTGWASRRVLLTAGAAWTLGVLGAVTLIALFVRG